jgi:anaerobic ribonucleoside-triphosphate reductase
VFYIGLIVKREDKDIIKISNAKNVKVALKSNIYIVLKSRRSISKAKEYYYIFKVAIASIEGYFLFITFLNIDLVVGVLDVNLTKEFSVGKIVKDL